MYSNETFRNPLIIKRFSHNLRFRLSLHLISPKDSDRILDYGTGDGHILRELYNINKKCRLVGYEPLENRELKENFTDNKDIQITNNPDTIDTLFNKITCFEVLEHLTPENQKKELLHIKKLLDKNGVIIVSVPIEKGVSSLLKNIIRIASGQKHEKTDFKNVIKSLFSIKIDRGAESYIKSHIGFYYTDLEDLFDEAGLTVKKKIFSPVKFFGPIINSQVFYVIENKGTSKKCYERAKCKADGDKPFTPKRAHRATR